MQGEERTAGGIEIKVKRDLRDESGERERERERKREREREQIEDG